MTKQPSSPLTFKDLDGIVFAAGRQKLGAYAGRSFHMVDLGPWFEMMRLKARGALDGAPAGLFIAGTAAAKMEAALELESTASDVAPIRNSFIVRPSGSTHTISMLTAFAIAVQKSATAAGIPKKMMLRLSSPLSEMFDNIFEHSEAHQTGLAAFRSLPGSFEFVVADLGAGVLASLRRSSRYAHLKEHGEALQSALQPEVSRFDEPGHGHGFDRLVEGMANMNSELRFRSGDAVVQMTGIGGRRPEPTVAKRPEINGFIVSAKFHASRSAS